MFFNMPERADTPNPSYEKNNRPTRIFMKRHGFKVATSAECTCFFIFFVGAEPDVPCPHTGTSPAASGSKPGSCTSSLYLQSGGRFFFLALKVLFFSFFFPGYFFWMDQGPWVCISDGTHLVRKMFGFKNFQLLRPTKWKKVLGDPLGTNWIHNPFVWDMKRHKSHHTLRIQLDLYFKILCLQRYRFHSEKGAGNPLVFAESFRPS